MYTVEEARISSPSSTYNIPEGAAREFGRDSISRALESEAEAVQLQRANALRQLLTRAWQKLAESVANQAPSHGST